VVVLRRYPFTTFAFLASLLWIGVLAGGEGLQASTAGRAYISLARTLFIPLYLFQTLLVILIVALRGGAPTSPDPPLIGISLAIVLWLFSLTPFLMTDWWLRRSRTSHNRSPNPRDMSTP
jgi:hypothetical protein